MPKFSWDKMNLGITHSRSKIVVIKKMLGEKVSRCTTKTLQICDPRPLLQNNFLVSARPSKQNLGSFKKKLADLAILKISAILLKHYSKF